MIPLLEARGLRRSRPPNFLLDIEELTVHEVEIVSILGPSGSGKSTLLSLLGLVEPADQGELVFSGLPVGPRSRSQRLEMAALLQSVPLFSGTVSHNVAYPLKIRGISSIERRRRVEQALEQVGMQGSEQRSVAELSGGEAQRVGLARALAAKPRLLLLDEPLAHSDEPLRESLGLTLRRSAKEQGFSIVWVTHDRSEALKIADRVAVLGGGRLLQVDAPLDLLVRPVDPQVAAIVGTENIWEGEIAESNEGLARVRASGEVIEAESSLGPGTQVLILLRPEDVTVTTAQPSGVVPRNRFRASITDAIHGVGTVKLTLRGSLPLVALMTRQSFEELGLAVGQGVWCSFKATACHLLRRS